MATSELYDVIQIGYGPVGQTSAALLGRYGHKVAVFERHAGLYPLSRAGHIDHEILRLFQSLGAASAILKDAIRCDKYEWRNQDGKTLLVVDWSKEGISGWASDYLFFQPYLEGALDAAVRRFSTVDIFQGWEAIDLEMGRDHVSVTLAQGNFDDRGNYIHTGERQTVRGRYVIGVDGANSFTRFKTGLMLEDLGFREQWLVTDFRQKRPLSFAFDNGQICDPARPMCLFQLGQTHRRFEFMLLPGENPEEMARHDSVWALVSKWISPPDAELLRAAVYTFRSATAQDWRSHRVFLAGDAAHLMPPFLGQGLCSGVRDVTNLSWKLDLVLRGLADERLLDSYVLERKPHVASLTEQAVMLGKVTCMLDISEAQERDNAFLAGRIPPFPPLPWLTTGIVHENTRSLAGQLGPQAPVTYRGQTGLADDVVGAGWQLICRACVIVSIDPNTRRILNVLNTHILELDTPNGVQDIDHVYRRFLDDADVDAILVRPDFYIYGAVTRNYALDTLVADLAGALMLF